MGSTWDHFGDIASVAQLTGVDAVRLIGMIVKAASTARMHKKNCMQFALHLKLIGNLLEQLKISEMKKYPETREPLEQLEDSLRRSYILVNSCQDRSFLYLLAMGWNIVYQFRKAQNEIDRYLKIIPLITLVDNSRARFKDKLEDIERDEREYILDDDDKKVQDVIMKPDQCGYDTATVLKKSLSSSYPNLPFNKAIQKENEKLRFELQRSQANYDVNQCQMIQHLLDVTEVVGSNCVSENISPKPISKDTHKNASLTISSASSSCHNDMISTKRPYQLDEWSSDLLGCCSEPLLCVKTCFCPCATFSRIVGVVTNRHVSTAEACNDLAAYSLILSCCCYTCCVRRKLRRMLNVKGGLVDDFLSHFMCCCCALVQEWQEVEIRGLSGSGKTKTSPPESQYMDS